MTKYSGKKLLEKQLRTSNDGNKPFFFQLN